MNQDNGRSAYGIGSKGWSLEDVEVGSSVKRRLLEDGGDKSRFSLGSGEQMRL